MKSEGSRSMFVIAILCVIVIVIVLLGRRDVKAGSSKIQQRFPLSIAESVYDREGFFEDRCAFYSDYDAIRSIKVTVQGEWESGSSAPGRILLRRKSRSRLPATSRTRD